MQMEAAVPVVESGVCVVFCIEQCTMLNAYKYFFFYLLRMY